MSEAKATGWLQSAVTTMHVISTHAAVMWSQFYFSSSIVVSRVCAVRIFNVQVSLSPPRLPLCQVSFLLCPHCWASLWRKIGYSITHSVTNPAYLIRREPKLSLWNNYLVIVNDALVPLTSMFCQQLQSRSWHVIAGVLNGSVQRLAQILVNITSMFSTWTSNQSMRCAVVI